MPWRLLLISILVIGVAACSEKKSKVGGFFDLDTDLEIDFIVDPDINPDEQGAASPLFVRMYQLKSDRLMNKSEFIDLYERDAKTLGSEMIGEVRRLKRFKPGENRTEIYVLDPDAQYVGLYAEFRDFKDSQFKLVVPVVINNVFRNRVVIQISSNTMSVVD